MAIMRAIRGHKGIKPSLDNLSIPENIDTSVNVLVKVIAAGFNPSDLLNSQGSFVHTEFPRTLGRDFAGVVVKGNDEWIGQEVYGTSGSNLSFTSDGTHAEYLVVPIDGLVLKPKSLSFVQSAAVGVSYHTAFSMLERTRASSQDTVLVLGASGSVGAAALQIAKWRGCKVYGATRNDNSNVNTINDPKLDAIAKLGGIDIVLDTVGDPVLTKAAFEQMHTRGRLALISGKTEISVPMRDFYRSERELIGVNSVGHTIAEAAQMLKELGPAFESGALSVDTSHLNIVVFGPQALDVYFNPYQGHVIFNMQTIN